MVETKIPNIGSLVKKTDCNTKIIEIEKKLINFKITTTVLKYRNMFTINHCQPS